MPLQLLGTIASSVQKASTAFESIATTTVGDGGTATVTFSFISSTYTHLQLRCSFLSSTNGGAIIIQLNSDTGSNYANHIIYGNGSSASSSARVNVSEMYMQGFAIAVPNTTTPTVGIIDFLDYASTNKFKTLRGLAGFDANGSGELGLSSGLWRNTNAITSVKITQNGTFGQYSHFALYGIKGA